MVVYNTLYKSSTGSKNLLLKMRSINFFLQGLVEFNENGTRLPTNPRILKYRNSSVTNNCGERGTYSTVLGLACTVSVVYRYQPKLNYGKLFISCCIFTIFAGPISIEPVEVGYVPLNGSQFIYRYCEDDNTTWTGMYIMHHCSPYHSVGNIHWEKSCCHLQFCKTFF